MNARVGVRRSAAGHSAGTATAALAVLFLGTVLGAAPLPAQDVDAVVEELFLTSPDPDAMTSAWWLPAEFFLLGEEDMTPQEEEELMEVLGRYTLVAVVDGEIGPFGGATFLPKEQLLESLNLFDANGTAYPPVSKDAVDPDVEIFLMMLRPALTGMLGPMAENMAFALFPARTPEGVRIADPLSEGLFSVRVGERMFDWQTPLGSMLPPKYCPIDGRRVSGGWRFCPWHGAELKDSPPSG